MPIFTKTSFGSPPEQPTPTSNPHSSPDSVNYSMNSEELPRPPSTRSVRWTKSAKNNASKQEQRRKTQTPLQQRKRPKVTRIIQEVPIEVEEEEQKEEVVIKYQESELASWLRSNKWTAEADLVDNIESEIVGAASDTMLAFQQVFSAFTIDEDVLGSMAENIKNATEDLTRGKYSNSNGTRRR